LADQQTTPEPTPFRRRMWIALMCKLGEKGFSAGLIEADEMGPAPDGTFFWNWDPGKRNGARHGVLHLGSGSCRICREVTLEDLERDLALVFLPVIKARS